MRARARDQRERRGAAILGTMDRDVLGASPYREAVEECFEAQRRAAAAGAPLGSWWRGPGGLSAREERVTRGSHYAPLPGSPDDGAVPWFECWAVAHLLVHAAPAPGDRVGVEGDAGGLLAAVLRARGATVAEAGKDGGDDDVARLYSICVTGGLPWYDGTGRGDRSFRLREEGLRAVVFDYLRPSRRPALDGPGEVAKRLGAVPGLEPAGDAPFRDNGRRYLEDPAFFRREDGRLRSAAARLGQVVLGVLRPGRWRSEEDRHYTWGIWIQRRRG